MRYLWLSFLAVLFIVQESWAENVTAFTLTNGMDVVVIEDHRAPVVTHMVWYRAGSADEPFGHSGIAHFLEHLLFKGTEKFPEGVFSEIVQGYGGSENAFTAVDYTGYFQRVAAPHLEKMMEMESDRMRNARITEEDIATERDVILEERSQRVDSIPQALFFEQMQAAQYLHHPYRIPVSGWRHEMEKLSREDALRFYQQFYAPNNAILVIAGDVISDDVHKLAERYYGVLPANPDLAARVRPSEPKPLVARHLVYQDERVAQPFLLRNYLVPPRKSGAQKQAAALALLAEILGGDSALSVLGKDLIFEKEKILQVEISYTGLSLDATLFSLGLVPKEGVSLEETETLLDEALQAFLKQNGVEEDMLARIKQQVQASHIYAKDNVVDQAHLYGEALAVGLNVQDVQEWPSILDQVSMQDIMDAARMIFFPENSVTGYIMATEGSTEESAEELPN